MIHRLTDRLGLLSMATLVTFAQFPGNVSAADAWNLHLHGRGMAKMSMAAAMMKRLGRHEFSIKVTASELPSPTSLQASPQRHVYIAWASESMSRRSPFAPIPLTSQGMGVYTGTRKVRLLNVARVFVTAETVGTVKSPHSPQQLILDSVKS